MAFFQLMFFLLLPSLARMEAAADDFRLLTFSPIQSHVMRSSPRHLSDSSRGANEASMRRGEINKSKGEKNLRPTTTVRLTMNELYAYHDTVFSPNLPAAVFLGFVTPFIKTTTDVTYQQSWRRRRRQWRIFFSFSSMKDEGSCRECAV
ncbi:hypothetical protein F4778DRAFT_201469 [Xylariomycetidae sp. FL2044]|nr:hypothetical protein F4778DRAFT_201469 [Xylariomycetidae sp. FL2044]